MQICIDGGFLSNDGDEGLSYRAGRVGTTSVVSQIFANAQNINF